MIALGRQYMMDMYNCSAKVVYDLSAMEAAAFNVARRLSLPITDCSISRVSDSNYSGVLTLGTCQLTFMTWGQIKYVSVCFYTFGDAFSLPCVTDAVRESFSAKSYTTTEVARSFISNQLAYKIGL